ncbi:hypothetical protein BDA96_01G498700 [Sorghum bicolor]|uniref:Uncharacterized protein n=2 Tax=Sorghum bicolor TaxID=4558 RepID=A0A921V3V9_SORBI|nr:uncharacterized protein LOC8054240 [Sorghum bicolor]KAG0552326.1 hypothetical protein BDA96_01G498700 [Sorghum bicolor]KXG39943.1 hypothetical protein SORBI_3001G467500 [Sorghum bicolor]|eukprot:XP_021316719.1 uncharacterized protein LOC8054240 [Sorghum bicolor]
MGNCQCQAAEVATVLIQHPGGGRTERAYWALSASAVMAANPGHYVAAVITTTAPGGDGAASSAAATVKHLKLLRPDDTLLLGRVYRLVSFEEVLREFASKRQVKLSRVTVRAKDEAEDVKKPASKHRRRRARASSGGGERKESSERSLAKVMRQTEEELEPEAEAEAEAGPSSGPSGKHADTPSDADADLDADLEALLQPHGALLGRRAARQWRPALQSIAEG